MRAAREQYAPWARYGAGNQDAVIARRAERELGISAHLAGENAFSYGLLHGRDTCDAPRLQAQGWQTWQRASRPRYRRWMH